MLSFPRIPAFARVYLIFFALAVAFSVAAAATFPVKTKPKDSPFVFIDIDGKGHGSGTHVGGGLFHHSRSCDERCKTTDNPQHRGLQL